MNTAKTADISNDLTERPKDKDKEEFLTIFEELGDMPKSWKGK